MRAHVVLSIVTVVALGAGCGDPEELDFDQTAQPITVSPASYDFAGVGVQWNASTTFSVSHTGFGFETIGDVSLGCAAGFQLGDMWSVAYEDGFEIARDPAAFPVTINRTTFQGVTTLNTLEVNVAFAPMSRGAQTCNAVVDFTTDADRLFAMSGTGVAPELSLTLVPGGYGSRRINTTSATQTFRVSNDGDPSQLLYFAAPTLSANSEDWVVSFDTSPLSPGFTRDGTVAFSPKAVGAQNATFLINSNDPVDVDETITLTGTGTSALVSVPSTLNIGSSVVNVAKTMSLPVTNPGTAALTIHGTSDATGQPGDFSVTAPMLPTPINPGPAVNLTVQCRPTAVGTRTTNMTIDTDSDVTPTQDPVVTLSCTGTTPDITVSSISQFADTAPGSSRQQTINVSNANLTTTSLLTVAVPSMTGHAGDFSIAPPGAFMLNPGETRPIVVTFAPQAFGLRDADLTFSSDDQESPTIVVDLTGNGFGPEIDVTSPADESVEFGDVSVTTTSSGQTVTVRNPGNSPLSITSATLVNGDVGDFGLTGPASATVSINGGTQSWTVTCSPLQSGPRSTTLRLLNNDPSEGTKNIALTCNGTQGNLVVVSPTVPVQFGTIDLPASSAEVTVTVRNGGTAALTIPAAPAIGISGPFAIVTPLATPVTLQPTQTATIGLRFTPVVDGAVSGQLTVPYNTGVLAQLVVGLAGTGRAAHFALSNEVVGFDDVLVGSTTTTRTFTIDNTGSATLNLTSAVEGGATADFEVVSPTFPTTVSAGSNRTVTVRCTPTVLGPRNGHLTFGTDADLLLAPDTRVDFTCNGVRPDIVVSIDGDVTPPYLLDFGAVAPGTSVPREVVVSNMGGSTSSVVSVSAPARNGTDQARYTVSPPGAFTLFPGDSRTLTVTFTPSGFAAFLDANLVINSDDPDEASLTVDLDGRGEGNEITIVQPDGAAIGFVDTIVGDASPATTVEVHNDGNATLEVTAVLLVGAQAGQFEIAGPPSAAIGGMTSASWTVRCKPTSAGDKAATLEIRSDDADELTKIFTLTCRGTQPLLVLTSHAPPVTFVSTRVGNLSPAVVVTVENQGTAALTFSSPDVNAPFEISTPLGAASLAPGAGTSASLRFRPTAGGTANGTLSLNWTAGSTSGSLPVSLSGVGTVAVAQVTPSADDDGDFDLGAVCVGQPRAQRFTITSAGTGSFDLIAVTPNNPMFAVTPVTPASYPATLVGGATATFDLTVDPELGDTSTMLTITTDIPSTPTQTLLVTASGLAGGLGVAPADGVEFAPTEPTESSDLVVVTVTNCEAGTLTITAVSLQGTDNDEFQVVAGTLPGNPIAVPSAATTQWSVEFQPQDVGAAEAALHIVHDQPAGGGVIDVPLYGYGGTEAPDAGLGPDAGSPDAGTGDGSDAGEDPGLDRSSYYSCSVGAPSVSTLLLLVGAIVLVLRRRRRAP